MVKIGTVWDRTVEVLGGRTSILSGIAVLLLLLPQIIQAGAAAVATPNSGLAMLASVLSLIVLVFTVWGTLAITAVGSDPTVTRDQAIRVGLQRLPAGLGILLLIVLAALILSLPGVYLLHVAGFDWQRASAGLTQTNFDPARAGVALLYFFVFAILALWFSARAVPLMAVVVNERLGLRAIARSFVLTKGSTFKLIGVLILYAIVLLVVTSAATLIVGLILRLVLGQEAAAGVAFGVALVSAIVTTIFGVIQYVFGAQVYRAAVGIDGRGEATTRA